MKKSIYVLFMLVILMISVSQVEAFECRYGTGNGDDWFEVVTFRVHDKDDIDMNLANHDNFLHPLDTSGSIELVEGDDCQGCAYMEKNVILDYYFYIALYANDLDYETKLEQHEKYCSTNNLSDDECEEYAYLACPEFIQHEETGTGSWDLTEYLVFRHFFYTDALTDNSIDDLKWYEIMGMNYGHDVLVLEQSKEKDVPEDLTSSSYCATYNNYIQAMTASASNHGTCEDNDSFQHYYNEILSLCENYRSSSDYADNFESSEPKVSGCMTACSYLRDDVVKICGYYVEAPEQDGSCYSLGDGVLGWIMKILDMIRYILPVILIILGILDFIKAIGTDDEGEIKKAGSKFVKRLIAAALIFIVPLILQFVLGLFNLPGLDPSNPFCL